MNFHKIIPALFLFWTTTALAEASERTLDAGTWIRPSLSLVPAEVGNCPSEETFVRRAIARLDAGRRRHLLEAAEREGRQDLAFCQEARESLSRSLEGDWSGLLSMQRFDRNDLPSDRLDAVRQSVAGTPWQGLPEVLSRELADTLRGLLAQKALERSAHLASEEQKNSAVADKMRTQDVTDAELSLLRASAHVLALRVRGLDVQRTRDGTRFKADFSVAIWNFDSERRTFSPEGAWSAQDEVEGHSPNGSGAEIAKSSRSLAQRALDLKPFHFSAQILSGHEGSWVNPASNFATNTGADLSCNRRFRYFENRADASGNTVTVPAGYGYLDRHTQDSLWRLRHIGGIQPYAGLVLEEIPGDLWGFLSLTQVSSRIDGDRNPSGDTVVHLRAASPLWELRLGTRTPLGSSHSFFSLDIPFYFGDVHGVLSIPKRDSVELGTLFGWGIEPGWETRWNIRRLFFTAGAQVGLRMNTVFVSSAQSGSDLEQANINWLRNFEGTLTLHAGASWSLTPWSGLGLEVAYDWLDGRSDWEYGSGNSYYDADWSSLPGRTTGQGRWRALFQYVWK